MPDRGRDCLTSIAAQLDVMRGRCHPGRPAYYALSRAYEAVRSAAVEVGEEGAPFSRPERQRGGRQ